MPIRVDQGVMAIFYVVLFLDIEIPFTGNEKTFKHRILSYFYTCYKNFCSFKWKLFKLLDYRMISIFLGSAHGVMVIIVGNGHGDTSSNPGRDWLHFT